MDFGGLGGFKNGRPLNPEDKFETVINMLFGERLRAEGRGPGWARSRLNEVEGSKPMLGQRIYGSLTNVGWKHTNGDTAGYSFRATGDLLAAIVGQGEYMDWYCTWYDGRVDEEFAAAMLKEGWTSSPCGWVE